MANNGSSPAERVTLIEAVTRWLDPVLVARVQDAERGLTPYEHDNIRSAKLTPRSEWREPTSHDWMRGGTDYTTLEAAWADLLVDLRRRIEMEELFVAGVPEDDPDGDVRRPINNLFAASMIFGVGANVIDCRGKKYLSVRVSRAPFEYSMQASTQAIAPQTTDARSIAPTKLGTDDVSQLSDHAVAELLARYARQRGWPGVDTFVASELGNLNSEQVAALLERHADDVVRETGISILPPGKVSPIPLIIRKMRDRAAVGELLSSLSDEADWLERWAAKKAPSYQSVGAKTIINRTNRIYADLKKSRSAADE